MPATLTTVATTVSVAAGRCGWPGGRRHMTAARLCCCTSCRCARAELPHWPLACLTSGCSCIRYCTAGSVTLWLANDGQTCRSCEEQFSFASRDQADLCGPAYSKHTPQLATFHGQAPCPNRAPPLADVTLTSRRQTLLMLRKFRGAAACWQGAEPVCQLSNLWPGCSYSVRARAQNTAGFGPTSAPVDVATAPDVPRPPCDLHVATRYCFLLVSSRCPAFGHFQIQCRFRSRGCGVCHGWRLQMQTSTVFRIS